MYFTVPDIKTLKDKDGKNYTAYNIYSNGVYHSSVRYSQLLSLHEELKKKYGFKVVGQFPPKKLFSLSAAQTDQRREQLEKYLQTITQRKRIINDDIFNRHLVTFQQVSSGKEVENVELDIYLLNGHKVVINISSDSFTDDALEAVASQLELPAELAYYFGLYIVQKKENTTTIVRKLQNFESPYLSIANDDSYFISLLPIV